MENHAILILQEWRKFMCNWVKEASFYHIYPLGFCGAPQIHQEEISHRITKIIDWIPHMKKMHMNAIYLGPIFASYEHGYDTSDYRMIDHRLGDNEDFKKVCDALHEAGIRIVLDGVFNHVGRYFWAFLDVKEKREGSPYANWFQNINFHASSPLGDDFTYETWQGYYNLVKLNLRNEEVVQYLLDSVAMWMDEFHIDGLRLDAADCIDKDFFRRLKVFTKQKNPDFWLMGEIIHGDYNMWANPEMLDSVTNYECYKGLYSSHNTKNYFEIAYSLNRQFGNRGIYKNLTLYNFVDNHDVNRLASTLLNQKDLLNVYTLLYTMPGVPSIYYGSEYALKGTKHDGSDADIRPCLDIDHIPDPNEELFAHICKLGEIYETATPLKTGSYEQILIRNEQYVFQRKNEHETVYVALNVSDEPYMVSFPVTESNLLDVVHEDSYVCEGCCEITLQPHDSVILIKNSDGNTLTKPKQKEKKPVMKKQSIVKLEEQEILEQTTTKKEEIQQKPILKQPETILPGRYRHFKGKDYAVLYIAKHSETLEEYVVYRQLYDAGDVWIRPLAMFKEMVEVDGEIIPRFQYLGK